MSTPKHRLSAIIDNHHNGTVGAFLKDVITANSDVSIVSAYFTIYAYHHLRENLDRIKKLRFLFGEPTFIKAIDPDKPNPREFKIQDDKLIIPMESKIQQKAIAKECAEWIRSKTEIRSMVKPNFLHGKLYHVTQQSGIEKALAGSSNFTVNGLGLAGSKNIELNLIIDSDRDRKELKDWFDAIWNDSTGLVEDVKEQVLKYLEQFYSETEPQFIYFKTLYHIFESYLNEQQRADLLEARTGFFESQIWNKLYNFQKDGVKGIINKILNYNGCIIADSVGLGKTFEALAVIKYFELLNARVLVICPKKLKGNWTIYQASQNHRLNPFKKDRFNYTVLYHTDMARQTGISDANGIDLANFNWGAYDLVVIDESHNFKGNPIVRTDDTGNSRLNRAAWLMEKIIKSGVKTKVLMLSATPVNNTLRDLRNQIYLITEGNDTALSQKCNIKSISQTIETAQRHFTIWADSKNKNRTQAELLERLDPSFFKLLDELTIARSRKHITSFYNLDDIGRFPQRNKPISVYPDIDTQDLFPSYDNINKQIIQYKLSLFNPTAYVKPDKQKKYEDMARGQVLNFKQSDREGFLIGMMKVNFLKRLESSIESFEISLKKTIDRIEGLQEKIKTFQQSHSPTSEHSLDVLSPDQDELEEDTTDDTDQWLVGKKLKFDLADLDLDRWLKDLKNDKDALYSLYTIAKDVSPQRDAKMKELKRLISEKINNPINKGNKKVLVFTAFADTAQYIYTNIKDWVRNQLNLHCALVCGSYTETTLGKNDYDSILTNFSPLSKNRCGFNKDIDTVAPPHFPTSALPFEQIDILIATDCISEGQNLQDCDYMINYDIHWNPVRIIQRFGRIDRLGSKNDRIQLVNFWATKDLDNYINLKERVEARMALVDITATGEDNILNTEQLQELITEDLKYRNQQLKRLQQEVIDIEEMDESVSLTDFTLDDFRIELLNYINNNKKRLADAPYGLYSIVPSPGGQYSKLIRHREFTESQKEIIKPGVIFCLAHKETHQAHETVNPLNPYFLIYIRNDGTVRYNYVNAKQILEIYRLVCQNCSQPYDHLCELFNQETANGEKMDTYSALMQKAVGEIIRVFKKKGIARLTSDRGASLVPKSKQISEINDFDLVTWLVIV